MGKLAAARRELREARKLLHPPGTIPEEASNIPSVRFKETQIRNDESSDALNGFAVSSGTVTAPASVILSQNDFDKMEPGSILVAPNTTPAWTQLFAHAVGLVTDMGSILAHGSIVAREYGIPAVLGVGNGTVRIKHGQSITIDGDAGSVTLSSPHFSPGAVMIAEDFGPVRVLATESIAGPTVEGACARTGPKDPRGHGQRSLQPARSLASRSTKP